MFKKIIHFITVFLSYYKNVPSTGVELATSPLVCTLVKIRAN